MSKQSVGALTRSSAAVVSQVEEYECKSLPHNFSGYRLQSEEAEIPPDGATPVAEDTSQTLSFIDNAEGEIMMAGSEVSPVAKVDGTADLQLGKFLSRPTVINSQTWSTSDLVGVKTTITPWHAFLNNAQIKKKIDNFAFIRAKLHVKIVVNGTPFQYGLMRVAYTPLLGTVASKIRTGSSNNFLLIPYSQQPGFYITPQANAGGQMELPFFYNRNWLNLSTASTIQNFGTLNYVIYAPLAVAVTGGSTAVTVTTFAWMSDVELMGSTSGLSLQARDEYQEGKVSKPASAVAVAASMLTSIPVIGPFARATTIGATAVASIARIFGYTNVPVIENIRGFQPMNAPMLASQDIGTPVQKLSLDPKQELSLDPTLHGLRPQDELSLPYLKRKESLFGQTSWSTSDTADTLLFCARVNPMLMAVDPILNSLSAQVGVRSYNTPVSYVSALFSNWRGSLVIRLKFVVTKFHKGRVKISYDPWNDISITNPDVNTVYTKIVDIGEQDDIEIEIPYHQDYPWLLVDKDQTSNWNIGAALAPRSGYDNGLLTIRVLTALTAPASGSISVLAYAKGGDDFELANPSDHIGGKSNYQVPSFYALQAADITDIVPERVILGESTPAHPERYGQNFGEAVGSLRNVLHRYMHHDTVWLEAPTALARTVYAKSYRIMPYAPGYIPTATGWPVNANKIVAASGTSGYAFNSMVHMPYVANMFLGYRGGANFSVTPQGDAYGDLADCRVTRWSSAATDNGYRYVKALVSTLLSGSLSTRAKAISSTSYAKDGLAGMAITATQTNSSVVFQLPDYKPFNFSFADPANFMTGSTADGTSDQLALLELAVVSPSTVDTSYLTIQTEVSAAPDFTCLFFLCCPTLDYATTVPTPV